MSTGHTKPIRLTGFHGAPQPEDCERGKSLLALSSEGQLLGCVLTDDNPVVEPPLTTSLKNSVQMLKKKLRENNHELCWT